MISESNVIDNKTHLYNRFTSISVKQLEKLISKYYKNNPTLITTSGLHAITTMLLSIGIKNKWENFNIVYANEMYGCTHKFLQLFVCTTYKSNLKLYSFTITDTDYLTQLFEDDLNSKINVLFLESCSNPNGKVMNFNIIPYFAKFIREINCCCRQHMKYFSHLIMTLILL